MARQLDERFQLDLLLMPTVPAYHRHLCALAERTPRVRVLAPVPMHELVTALPEEFGIVVDPTSAADANFLHADVIATMRAQTRGDVLVEDTDATRG